MSSDHWCFLQLSGGGIGLDSGSPGDVVEVDDTVDRQRHVHSWYEKVVEDTRQAGQLTRADVAEP